MMHIYIQTSIKGPRKQDGVAGFVLEDAKNRTFTQFGRLLDVSENEAHIKTLKNALEKVAEISESIDFTLWTDNLYMASVFRQGWLSTWSQNAWMTRKNKEVSNKEDWAKIAEILNGADIEVHLREHNTYKNWLVRECERRAKKYV